MSEWQPIETAPRDGTEILTWGSHVRRTAYWDASTSRFRTNSYGFVELEPTHWMPLPEPPK